MLRFAFALTMIAACGTSEQVSPDADLTPYHVLVHVESATPFNAVTITFDDGAGYSSGRMADFVASYDKDLSFDTPTGTKSVKVVAYYDTPGYHLSGGVFDSKYVNGTLEATVTLETIHE
ncbi:MAG: hypothetical protein QM831_14800 [Kofleriaceae bacterium]